MNPMRRAELKLAYKLNPPVAGVVAIRHLVSGKALIEGSRNVEGIINRHRFALRLGSHPNAALRSDWRRDGEAAFCFEIVATVAPSAEPGFDLSARLDALLDAALAGCPRGAPNSYL